MIYRTQGPLRYYYLVSRLLLTLFFALGVVAAAAENGWKGIFASLLLGLVALLCLKESWIYLRSVLHPVLLQIDGGEIFVRGLGRLPFNRVRCFSFNFMDITTYPNGLRVPVSRCSLTVSGEVNGRIKTRTFRILPERCMNMHVHEVLSALAAHYPGIKKVRKEKARGYADVFLDFENYKAH